MIPVLPRRQVSRTAYMAEPLANGPDLADLVTLDAEEHGAHMMNYGNDDQ